MNRNSPRSLVVADLVAKNKVATTGQSNIIKRKATRVSRTHAVTLVEQFLSLKGCCRSMHIDDNTLFYCDSLSSHHIFGRGTRMLIFISRAAIRDKFIDKIKGRVDTLEEGTELNDSLLPELRKTLVTQQTEKNSGLLSGHLKMFTKNYQDLFVELGVCPVTEKKLYIPFFVFEGAAELGLAPLKTYDFYGQRVCVFSDKENESMIAFFSYLDSDGLYNL